MKLLKSKQAVVFSMIVVLMVFIVLLFGYITLRDKTNVEKVLGENPSEMVINIQEGEKALVYVDLASKLAVQQALFQLQSKGGLTGTSACGNYYGFNMWNSESGSTCYVNRQVIEKSLRDLFQSNLVARLASYPNADFLTNTPAAVSFAKGAAPSAPGVSGGGATYCTGTQDLQKDFDYPHSSSGFYPKGGSRLFIPAEANCPGSYDLIVYLHGCQKTEPILHSQFGTGSYNIIPVVKNLLSKKAIEPVILAAPSQTKSKKPNAVCGSSLWGYAFDFKLFIEDVKKQLPEGITIKSISWMGHSGAGCNIASGIHRALQQFPDSKAIAQLDTCPAVYFGSSLKSKSNDKTKILLFFGLMGNEKDASGTLMRTQERTVLGITKDISCPATDVPNGAMDKCYSSEDKRFLSYHLKAADHWVPVTAGTEQFLLNFFKAEGTSATVTLADRQGCVPGQRIGVMGDSITEEGAAAYGYVGKLKKACPEATFEPHGIRGQRTDQMLARFKTDILDKNYNQVIIFGGTNDNIENIDVKKTENNLDSMYTQAKAKGMRVVAVAIPPYKGNKAWTKEKYQKILELNSWIKSNKNVDVVVDIYSALKDASDPEAISKELVYSSDHLHPNPAGHNRMAQIFVVQAYQKPSTTTPTGTGTY